jgi:hypothetical protein
MMHTDWRHHFSNSSAAYGRTRKTVFGLGTALSAALLLVTLSAAQVSMLVLSDGLCPAVAVALAAMAAFLYLSTVLRLRQAR